MPYRIRRVKGGYRVTGGGRVRAKHTTLAKARAQVRLLNAAERRKRR